MTHPASAARRRATVSTTAQAVLDLLLPLRREERTHDHQPADCFAAQLAQIENMVSDGIPLLFTLPAFPCKSPNLGKVLGHLPDYGELLALRSLQRLCEQVAQAYPPGARLLICSDGHVFADLIRVPDAHITEYTAELRQMIEDEGLDRIGVYTLADAYGDLDYDAQRALMLTQYATSLESLRAELKSDERGLALYRGITRFMVEDASGGVFQGTKSALLADSRKRAYGVIQRSRAWSDLVDDRIERSVRLSIHPQDCRTPKFGVRLLDISDSWMTPWHSVAVQAGDRIVLMKRHAAEQIGRLVVVGGRPSHFVAHDSYVASLPPGATEQRAS